MDQLIDYSGEFNPRIKLQDFSKEVVIQLLEMQSRLYLAVDGFWYLAVMEKVDESTAMACDLWVWEKQQRYEQERLRKLLNIQGNSLQSLLKCIQFAPWARNLEYDIDVKDNNLAVFTVSQCLTLQSMEKEGKGRDNTFCKSVETKMFNMYVNSFNPDIKVTNLKMPPRKSKDDIFCQWEFKMIGSTD